MHIACCDLIFLRSYDPTLLIVTSRIICVGHPLQSNSDHNLGSTFLRRAGDRGLSVGRPAMKLKLALLASASLLALTAPVPAAAQEFSVFINRSLAPDAYCSPRRQQLPRDENTPVAMNDRTALPDPRAAIRNTATVSIVRNTRDSRNEDASLGGITSILYGAQFQQSLGK